MAEKQIRGIDPRLWGLFTGICKMKSINVGDRINKLIERDVIKFTSRDKVKVKK